MFIIMIHTTSTLMDDHHDICVILLDTINRVFPQYSSPYLKQSMREIRNYQKKVQGPTRLVHASRSAPQTSIVKLDASDEKLMLITTGFRNRFKQHILPDTIQQQLARRDKLQEYYLQRANGLSPCFVIRRLNNMNLSKGLRSLVVSFHKGRQNKLVETFLLEEMIKLYEFIPKILDTFQSIKISRTNDMKRDRSTRPIIPMYHSLTASEQLMEKSLYPWNQHQGINDWDNKISYDLKKTN